MSAGLDAGTWWEALAGAAEDGQGLEVRGLAEQFAAQASPDAVAGLVYALVMTQRDLAEECQRLAAMVRHPAGQDEEEQQ